jgi:hypothetical protein
MIKLLLQLLAVFLNAIGKVIKSEAKPIPLCHVYGKYGLEAPAFVGHVNTPSVSTGTPTSIAQTSFTANGNITNTGGANPTVRGFCYIVGDGTPTISDTVVNQTGSYSTGAYSLSITGLTADTLYSVRAYATNSAGTGYGATIEVVTLANQPPDVVLNSPANEAEVGEEPELEFTGTDPENDDIRYQIQIFDEITNSDFNRNFGASSLGHTPATSTSTVYIGSALELPSGILENIKMRFGKTNSPTFTIKAYLWEISGGTVGTDARPNINQPIAISNETYTQSDVTSSPVTLTFNFKRTQIASGDYCIGVAIVYSNGGSALNASVNISDDTLLGNVFTSLNSGSTFNYASPVRNYGFEYNYSNLTPNINAVSGTDDGFENTVTPADTDPFTHNQKIKYTIQSPMDSGQYFWHVRGSDPGGSNTWGAWSSVREFTVEESSDPTISINQGAYSLGGQTLNLSAGRLTSPQQGSYSLAGQSVNFAKRLLLVKSRLRCMCASPSVDIENAMNPECVLAYRPT